MHDNEADAEMQLTTIISIKNRYCADGNSFVTLHPKSV